MNRHSTFVAVTLPFVICSALAVRPVAAQDDKAEKRSLAEDLDKPLAKNTIDLDVEPMPDVAARKAFAAPPEAKSLSKKSNLWVDRKRQRVYADGYVAMREGQLEMFACPIGTKEHESVVATLAKSSELHAALLAIGAMPGTPVRHVPEFVPPTGQRIRVWVCWRDKQGKFQTTDARNWVQKMGTKEALTAEWVFAGSGVWEDPSDGRKFYRADSGDMICVSNFSSAMMDLTISSSAQSDSLMFTPYTDRVPPRGTPIRLVLVPIPNPSDQPNQTAEVDANKPPDESVLPSKSE